MAQRKRSSLVAHLLRGNAIATPPAVPRNPWIGHNGGPPPDDLDLPLDPGASWRHYCWKKAHQEAWKTPPREIALRRLARALELGMSYRDYTLEILDTGRFL
jgi:hypothetical protein